MIRKNFYLNCVVYFHMVVKHEQREIAKSGGLRVVCLCSDSDTGIVVNFLRYRE